MKESWRRAILQNAQCRLTKSPRTDSLIGVPSDLQYVQPADKKQQRTKASIAGQLDMKITSVLRPFPRYTQGAEVKPPFPTCYFPCWLPSASLKPLSTMGKR